MKDLFDARAFNTTRVEIVRGGQTMAFEKQERQGRTGQGRLEAGQPRPKAADTAKVEALLTALTNARATSFVDKTAATGLDTPEVTVTLKYEDGPEAGEGRVRPQRRRRLRAARRRRGAAKIDASALDGIIKALDALK